MYNPTKPYKHQILKLVESTWASPYVQMKRGLYPVIRKKFSGLEVQHTDGIGTKGYYHWQQRTFRAAVQDALAMNLNDLLMVGAVPYALQNHIVLPKDDHPAILSIVRSLAQECRRRQIAMTGGETSIHEGVRAMDISLTVSGLIKTKIKNQCQSGDVIIGLPSHGLQANGFTKVREIFGNKIKTDFVRPTTIYYDQIFPLLGKYKINGLMHITGGAFTKLKDILGKNDAVMSFPEEFKIPRIFYDLYQRGLSNKEMYTTFNCGMGFFLSVVKNQALQVKNQLKESYVLGRIAKGRGMIKIRSTFDHRFFSL